jgi:DNA-binding response OmpR family regulator
MTRSYTRRDSEAQLGNITPDLILIDNRFLRFDPIRFCRSLREEGSKVPMLLIVKEENDVEKVSGIDIYLKEPFTARKLVNRIDRLLPPPSEKVITRGNLTLDIEQRTVSHGHSNQRLTPKQARLLEVFMRHTGQVLPRPFLMKQVWETDFVEDTRTLEVHVHWLRRAIENDPSRPMYLTTVRGIGYRFDIPASAQPGDVDSEK